MIRAIFQISGGHGVSTLAQALANQSIAPKSERVLVNMEPADANTLLVRCGVNDVNEYALASATLSHPQTTIYSIALDVGQSPPARLSPTDDAADWVLPMVPTFAFRSTSNPMEDLSWREDLLLILKNSNFDVVIDGGRLLPDRMMLHQRVRDFADLIFIVLGEPSDIELARVALAGHTDKFYPITTGEDMRVYHQRISAIFDAKPVLHLPRVSGIDASGIPPMNRKNRPYFELLREITA